MTEFAVRILRVKCIRTTGEISDEVLIDAMRSGGGHERLYRGNILQGSNLDLSYGIDPAPDFNNMKRSDSQGRLRNVGHWTKFHQSLVIQVTEEDTSTIGEEGNIFDTALDDTIGTFTVSESEAEQGRKVRVLEGSGAKYEISYEVHRLSQLQKVERTARILGPEEGREGFSNQRVADPLARCEANGALRWLELEWRYAAREGQEVGPPVAGARYVVAATSGGWRKAGSLNAQGFARIENIPFPCNQVRFFFHSDPNEYQISERYVRNSNIHYGPVPITDYIVRWLDKPSEWMWGAVQGDFNRHPGLGQIFFNTVLGLIPVVDQGLDARDLTANIITLVSEENAYQRWDVWLALGTTLIGCIPSVGSVFKGVVKAILGHGVQAGAALFRRVMAIMNEAGFGNAAGRFKDILEKLPQYADCAFSYLRRILEQLKANVQEVLRSTRRGVTEWVREWLLPIAARLDQALQALPGKLRRFKDILAEKTRGLWDRRPRHSEPVGVGTRNTVHQQRANVPLDNDVHPSSAPVRRPRHPRSAEELEDLARDPAHGGRVTPGSARERDVGLGLEGSGEVAGPITRDPTGSAEFIDGNGQAWDVKGFNSNYTPRKGGFSLERDAGKVERELASGENVMLDTGNLSPEHSQLLKEEALRRGWEDRVKFWP